MSDNNIPLVEQLKKITKIRAYLIIIIVALLFILVFASAVVYGVFIQPTYGERFANIFFMVSFTVIFFSLMYVYYICINRIERQKD